MEPKTTNGAVLASCAEALGIPVRTLADVKAALAETEGAARDSFARLMLRHGRLTDEARAYLEAL